MKKTTMLTEEKNQISISLTDILCAWIENTEHNTDVTSSKISVKLQHNSDQKPSKIFSMYRQYCSKICMKRERSQNS